MIMKMKILYISQSEIPSESGNSIKVENVLFVKN